MGAVLITVWMLLVLPILVVGVGLGGSLALDYTFARAGRSAGDDDGAEEESEAA